MIFLCAAAAGGETQEGRYALGEIRVAAGGHRVAENEKRIILDQVFDSDCETSILAESDPGKELPRSWILAGSRGETLKLDVRLLGCRRAEAPHVSCSWQIEAAETRDPSCRDSADRSSGVDSWQGFDGALEISLPAQTGLYELDLECRLGSESGAVTETLRRELYVTWAAPLAPFRPAESEWLARAACWAAGLSSEHREADVIEAIRTGLYRYGGDHWRYGYAKKVDDQLYRFLLAENEAGKTTVEYQLEGDLGDLCGGSSSYCKCPWQTLVDSQALCKFGDCYTFSHVLQSMSAVMGVGGLRPVMIQGDGNRGFVTKALPSLDPAFRGTARCDAGESCNFYYFGSHSLRARDDSFHDATFGKRYANADEPIAWNRTVRASGGDEDALQFADSARSWTLEGRGYGGWYFVRIHDPAPAQNSQASAGSFLRFTGNVTFEESDYDDDDLVESLVATVEVEVLKKGQYVVEAALLHHGTEVASRPAWDSSRSSGSVVAGEPGRYRVRLNFSGEQIHRSGLDGPYTLQATAENQGATISFEHETPDYDPRDFGELAGNLLSARATPKDEDGDGSAESIHVEVAAKTRESGVFGVEVRAAQDGSTLGYGGFKEDLFTGHHELEISVPIAGLKREDRPVELTIILYDPKLHAVSALALSMDPN